MGFFHLYLVNITADLKQQHDLKGSEYVRSRQSVGMRCNNAMYVFVIGAIHTIVRVFARPKERRNEEFKAEVWSGKSSIRRTASRPRGGELRGQG